MSELKKCPFCGEEARTIVDYDQVGGDKFIISAYVKCSKCGVSKRVSMDMKNASFKDYCNMFTMVESAWNNRADNRSDLCL